MLYIDIHKFTMPVHVAESCCSAVVPGSHGRERLVATANTHQVSQPDG